jgi:glutamine---fructose-6-phosphate transaminase (isomerizing)
MCGIFGLVLKKGLIYPPRLLDSAIKSLFLLSESRGKEASGIAFYTERYLSCHKDAVPARMLVATKAYRDLLSQFIDIIFLPNSNKVKQSASVLGHTRLATNGTEKDPNNNQPVITKRIMGIHNGIVVNSEEIHNSLSLPVKLGISDSEVIFNALEILMEKFPLPEEAVKKLYINIEGSASIAALAVDTGKLLLATNTGSLYVCWNQEKSICIFSSELPILKKLIKFLCQKPASGKYVIEKLAAGTGICISLEDLTAKEFSLDIKTAGLKSEYETSDRYFSSLLTKIKTVKTRTMPPPLSRCAKCILPETIPYIKFDSQGVCNYCLSHNHITYKGRDALESILKKYRKKNGEPDCLVAFSGGRDSAFALHYIKKVLKMNPIAFTFDWGMVADIARRNQARIVAKLGVEHVIISADIKKQRKFIRQNINAWMKNPHLGMVVLFMAGDKPAEYYAKKVAKEHEIDLVFLARGNELENTDFKWGFLGMPKGEPKGVLHDLSIPGRIRFSLNSARQFILNPGYFNSSIWETLFDYWTTYVLTYNFVYLWHYIPWDEAKIISILRTEYGWETPEDTVQTWRIDDGTSPFYNYIYYTLAGFTENDAFRSNQIREGILSRDDALALTIAENKPRYAALRDYMDKIGLDCDDIVKRIKGFPKLYRKG